MAEELTTTELARKWKMELDLAKGTDKKWIGRAKKIVKRYRDDSGSADQTRKYNILWANVQVLMPAIYSRAPKAEVTRRYKDSDPVGRCASEILERSLQYETDQYTDYKATLSNVLLDRLLGGRGTAWVRFETFETERPGGDEGEGEASEEVETIDAPTAAEPMQMRAPVDYVFWEDFRCSPARTWEEVTWVARRVYMGRKEGIKRFGDIFKEVPLSHVPVGLDQLKEQGATQGETDGMKKAKVWEIWDKTSEEAIWVAEDFDKTLDVKDDPYGLDGFFPCPKPLYATLTTDSLEPIPDYSMYQDQATELDMITNRIGLLVQACRVAGVYDASQQGIQRLMTETGENVLIPVSTWAAFGEKGGLKGTIDWMPLEQVIKTLSEMYAAQAACIKTIYDITGIADIMRGDTVASETATAQNIKRQFGSLRIRCRQRDFAEFASEILRIKAQLMCDLYDPRALIEMSGIMGTEDKQYAEQAVALLKQEPMRAYRVEVAADSLVDMDEEAEKAARVEFLGAAGGFLQKALPTAQAYPQIAPLLGEMLMFGVRAFKAGRPIEAAFDQVVQQLSQPQQPQPNPEMMKLQADQQMAQAKMQADQVAAQQKMQMDAQMAQVKAQAEMEVEKMRMQMQAQVDNNRQQAEAQQHAMKIDSEARLAQMKQQLDQQNHLGEMEFQRWKAELEAATRIEVAKLNATKVADSASQTAEGEITREVQT